VNVTLGLHLPGNVSRAVSSFQHFLQRVLLTFVLHQHHCAHGTIAELSNNTELFERWGRPLCWLSRRGQAANAHWFCQPGKLQISRITVAT